MTDIADDYFLTVKQYKCTDCDEQIVKVHQRTSFCKDSTCELCCVTSSLCPSCCKVNMKKELKNKIFELFNEHGISTSDEILEFANTIREVFSDEVDEFDDGTPQLDTLF